VAKEHYHRCVVGLARTIYIRWCIYGIFGREITEYTVIYSVYIRFWPTQVCIDDRVVQFGVRSKVQVRELSRILTNPKNALFPNCLGPNL
jgi:hypothetical protein